MRERLPSTRPLVTDCAFLQANDAARELLGADLEGRFWSEFRPPEVTQQCQWRHVAALKNPESRINDTSIQCFDRGGLGGETVWCRKEVTTYHGSGGTVWVTRYHVVSQPGSFTAHTLEELAVTLEDIEGICGTHTVASVQSLTRLTPLDTILPQNLRANKHRDCHGVRLRWNEPNGIPRKRTLCSCRKCGHIWIAAPGKIPRWCANRATCGTEVW